MTLRFSLLATLGVALLVVVATLAAAPPQAYADDGTPAAPTPASTPAASYRGPETCAMCHAEQVETWSGAPHADAFKVQAFKEAWEAVKSPGYCLACHTTGYDPNTGAYAFEGVSCESCHGPYVEGHPLQPMQVNSSPEACGVCHRSTLNEWQLSQHGLSRIGCVSCHESHGQNIKAEKSDELCVKCHAGQAEMGSHPAGPDGTELLCADCHVGPRGGDPAEGHANTGHTFTVGTQICSRCHADEVHRGVATMMGGEPTPTAEPPTAAPSPTGMAGQPAAGAAGTDMTGLALPVGVSGVVGLAVGVVLGRVRGRKVA